MNINIDSLDINELPKSFYFLVTGRRRSGKTVLTEYLIKELYNAKRVNFCFLFSKTDAGFPFIPREDRFNNLDMLYTIVDNYKMMNEYNDCCPKSKQIKLHTVIIVDDMANNLKDKNNRILQEMSLNGRHAARNGDEFSLSFIILSQALMMYPRSMRLNCDMIAFNQLSSIVESENILKENFFILKSDRKAKQQGRDLYHKLVAHEDFCFCVILNFKQNIREYSDYIRLYKAII